MIAFLLGAFKSFPSRRSLHKCKAVTFSASRCCAQAASSGSDVSNSLLADVSENVKLNAVCEALAREGSMNRALEIAGQMREHNVMLSKRALVELVDAAVLRGEVEALHRVFEVVKPKGYGSWRLEKLPENVDDIGALDGLPDKKRGGELVLGAAFLGVVGLSVGAEVIEPLFMHRAASEATTVLIILGVGLLLDRYVGAGRVLDSVTSGLGRLLRDDPVRESKVDAGALLTAYALGLPWICFRGNPKEALKFHKTYAKGPGAGRLSCEKYLVWLMAGVAAEKNIDGRLIESSSNHARTLLRYFNGQYLPPTDFKLIWALAQAEKIIATYAPVHERLAKGMLEGLSVGECVRLLVDSVGECE